MTRSPNPFGPHGLISAALLLLAVVLWLAGATPTSGAIGFKLGQKFTGSTFGIDSPYVPPDCNGMADANYFVELINGRFSVYSKTNGLRVYTSSDLNFWINSGVSVGRNEVSDPRVIYDPSSSRWFASAIDLDRVTESSNRFLIAISTTADPTKTWKGVSFAADPLKGTFADFPTFGLDKNGVYIAGYMFDTNGNSLEGNGLVSIPKADLLAATPSVTRRKSFGFLPGSSYGHIFQPIINLDNDGGSGQVLAVGSLGIDFVPHSTIVWTPINNPGSPTLTTLGSPVEVTVPQYSVPINPPQPGGTDLLDDGDARFSGNVYQVGGVIYGVHSIDVNDRAAVRWYRLEAATGKLLETGTITHPDLDLFFPSIAANSAGVVVIGCNGCSSNTYVSCFTYVGHTAGGTTTLSGPNLVKSGLATYDYQPSGPGSIYRWGDYSATSVDPADPYRFWTIQMYPAAHDTWATYIAEVRTAIPQLAIGTPDAQGQIPISWSGTDGVYVLERTDQLSGGIWVAVPQSSSTSGGRVQVLVPVTAGAAFFRLNAGGPSGS
jgi:hypothetical protein